MSDLIEPQIVADPNAVLAALATQLNGVIAGQERQERQLEKLDAINAAVGELRVSLASKADTSALTAVDMKVAMWMGQFKGALTVATLLLGFVQLGVIGGVGYVFSHLVDNETRIAVLSRRMDDAQRDQHYKGDKTLWDISTARSRSSWALKRD